MDTKETLPYGKTVRRIAVREFWLDGVLKGPCSPIFIEDEDLTCWQLYLDDEDYKWKFQSNIQPFPEFGEFTDENGMLWKDVAVSNESHLLGKTIISFDEKYDAVERKNSARLCFDNGWMIETACNLKDETESYEVLENI